MASADESYGGYDDDDFEDDGSMVDPAAPGGSPGGKFGKLDPTLPQTNAGAGAGGAAGPGAAVSPTSSKRGRERDLETIEKLRLANAALRHQLKEFSRALDASLRGGDAAGGGKGGGSLNQGSAATTASGAGFHAARQGGRGADERARQQLRHHEKMLRNATKKIEIYRRGNQDLRRQLASAFNSDRLVQLENENKEREREIAKLQGENRSLLNIQRAQTRQIEKQESLRNDWPARISSMNEDLRVAKEKLRRSHQKDKSASQQLKKQHEQLSRLTEENKRLTAEKRRLEGPGGGRAAKTAAELEKEKAEKAWSEERGKLDRKIAVLEKIKRQEVAKAKQKIRENNKEVTKAKDELDRYKRLLTDKDKEMRMQLLQVKKLKRQLREIALGDGTSGLPLPALDDGFEPSPPAHAPNPDRFQGRGGGGGGGGGKGGKKHGGGKHGHHHHASKSHKHRGGNKKGGHGHGHGHHHHHRHHHASGGSGAGGGGSSASSSPRYTEPTGSSAAGDVETTNELDDGMDEVHAARRVQATYRGHAGRAEGARRRQRRDDDAATKVQATYRGQRGRRLSKQREVEVRSRHAVEEKRTPDSYADDEFDDDDFEDDAPVESKQPPAARRAQEQKKPSAFAKPMGMRKKKKKKYT